MKYEIKFTAQFKRDLRLAKKQGKNLDELFTVIDQLANDTVLEAKYRDHSLSGNYNSYRECHIDPDWLLIYKKESFTLVLLLYRLGTHSDLF
ncbi:MAG: type II toxin-antitoxin system YafQ family toxin [Clostridiales bacterium]|nr:type II toxin-antitoxin system YafQ family toxin [Clostridiales bacterium]